MRESSAVQDLGTCAANTGRVRAQGQMDRTTIQVKSTRSQNVTAKAHNVSRRLQSSSCPPGTTASYGDETLAFRFRSEDITEDDDGPRWNAAFPLGLAFTSQRPVDPVADETGQPVGTYSYWNITAPSLTPPPGVAAGVHFESGGRSTYDQMMLSNQKVAIGAANTFFAVVTPAATANAWNSLIAFRPGDAIGTFSWAMGTYGCPPTEGASDIGCLFVDDWSPSGFHGPPFRSDVTQIVIYRSELRYNDLVSL